MRYNLKNWIIYTFWKNWTHYNIKKYRILLSNYIVGNNCLRGLLTLKFQGDEYKFTQDWGEQLVGKKVTVIAEYNLEHDKVEVLKGLPENVCVAQVRYSPDASYVLGVAYDLEPRKLGLIYCTNRKSTIFKLDFNENYGKVI